jgi:GTP cyclohydrolase I
VTQPLLVARDGAGVDLEAACRAAADFLSALGVAIDQEDLRDTPARMARAGVLRAGWRTTLNTNCPLGQKGSRHG